MKKEPRSLNRLINTSYILFLAVIIIFSILFANFTTSKEITATTFRNTENNLKDKHRELERTFDQLFEQLVYLNNNPNLIEVINDDSGSLKLAVNMNASIKDLYYRFQDVLSSIYININDGEFFFNGGTIRQNLEQINYQTFFSLSEENQYFWLDSAENPFSTEAEPQISVGKTIGDDFSDASGVIVFNLKSDTITELLKEGYVTEKGQLFLVSDQDQVYPVNHQVPEKIFLNNRKKQTKVKTDKGLYHTFSEEFSINNWRLMAVFPDSDLQQGQLAYLNMAIALILFLFVAGTVMMAGVGRFVSKPIRLLAKKIETTSITENTEVLTPDQRPFQELAVLYESFNTMIHNNERLLNENRHSQEERNRLEIELLQSQINPHFLYNTLYSIQALSDMGMNEDAAAMSKALADFYRQGISDESVLVSIADELEHVQSYLTIMSYRYGDRFDYQIEIEEPVVLEAEIPRISLQPIVENSIYHGLKELADFGHLVITVKLVQEAVLIKVRDNGRGISPENIGKINQEINQPAENERKVVGIGLRSVNLRIKRYFGSAYGIWLEATETGTIVKLAVPLEVEK